MDCPRLVWRPRVSWQESVSLLEPNWRRVAIHVVHMVILIPPDGPSAASKPSEGIVVRDSVDWLVVIPPDGLSAAGKPSEGIVARVGVDT